MERPPRRRTDHVITPALLTRAYVWLGPLQGCATMAAFYFFYWIYGHHQGQWLDLPTSGSLYQGASTMALAMIVTTQIGNLFAHRGERLSIWRLGWFTNRLVWLGIATELLLIGLTSMRRGCNGCLVQQHYPPVPGCFCSRGHLCC
jgi:magnesium-transporting ATPase (P-type)